MVRLHLFVALSLLVACTGSGDGDGDGDGDSDVDADSTPLPNCDGSGFDDQALLWDLPFTLRQGGRDYSVDSQTAYHLIDFTSDGLPDFVLTTDFRASDADPLAGSNHWLVFENTGDGFSSDPIQWTVPYDLTRVRGADQLNSNSHTIMDIDGDGTVEFLVHRDNERPNADALVGSAYWLVFENTGLGFSREASDWRLPFSLTNSGDNSEPSNASHTVIALADSTPGFLVIRDNERAAGQRALLVGSNHWLLFEGDGAGFSTDPIQWQLPFALDGTRNVLSNSDHALLDIRGEGVPDFLVIDDVERTDDRDPLVGSNHWLVFENTGSGFERDETQWLASLRPGPSQ